MYVGECPFVFVRVGCGCVRAGEEKCGEAGLDAGARLLVLVLVLVGDSLLVFFFSHFRWHLTFFTEAGHFCFTEEEEAKLLESVFVDSSLKLCY